MRVTPQRTAITHDVVVCGAGPAGAVVARRLAAAGLRVALVGMGSRPGWEGLSARSRALLGEEGLDGMTDVLAGPCARCGSWGDGRPVEGIEWLAERSRLAEAVCIAAISAGVDHRLDTVTNARRAGDQWRVALRGGGVLAAPTLIDARGRRGPQRRGPLLLAVGRRLKRPERSAGASGDGAPGTSATGIGVADFGWAWWAELGRMLWVQVIGRPRSGHPAEWLGLAAAQIPALARALNGASLWGDAVARPAHTRLGIAGHDSTLWHVGDAALALDPLSGQGIFEAIRGAHLVATAIQSVMNGGDAGLAHRFIADRQEEAWRRGVRVASEFYRENRTRGAFWRDTSEAYAALLPAPAAATKSAAPARMERRPVLDAGRILERDVVVTADHPRGVWHIGGVPLATLKHYFDATEHATVAGAAAALHQPLAAVASAHRWLQQLGPMLSPPRVTSGG
jgi:flavin-dependent dehydrogenase